MKQLFLTEKQFTDIGFAKEFHPHYADKEIFSIPIVNGKFFCVEINGNSAWYHHGAIGHLSNSVLLDIQTSEQLYTVLQTFKTKFNKI